MLPRERRSALLTDRCDRPLAFPIDLRFFLAAAAAFETFWGLGDFDAFVPDFCMQVPKL
jgi:hypothetical protein